MWRELFDWVICSIQFAPDWHRFIIDYNGAFSIEIEIGYVLFVWIMLFLSNHWKKVYRPTNSLMELKMRSMQRSTSNKSEIEMFFFFHLHNNFFSSLFFYFKLWLHNTFSTSYKNKNRQCGQQNIHFNIYIRCVFSGRTWAWMEIHNIMASLRFG